MRPLVLYDQRLEGAPYKGWENPQDTSQSRLPEGGKSSVGNCIRVASSRQRRSRRYLLCRGRDALESPAINQHNIKLLVHKRHKTENLSHFPISEQHAFFDQQFILLRSLCLECCQYQLCTFYGLG